MRTRYGVAVGRTSIDDWIEDDGEGMDLEHEAPSFPRIPEREPRSPLYPDTDSEAEMDTGLLGLLNTCSGSEEIRKIVQRDSDEIMKLVRDLG